MIETVDDIVEQVADWIGAYGAHDPERCTLKKQCRMCFVESFRDRIVAAVQVEQKLGTIDKA